MFHINTQIPWHRLGPARVYTGTTAAFHDTRPLSPPAFSAPPRLLRFVHPTLLYHHRHYRTRRARPIFGTLYLSRPSKGPLRLVPHPCPTLLRSGGQPPFPFPSGSLSSRPSYTAPPDAFADRPFLSHPGPPQGPLPCSPL